MTSGAAYLVGRAIVTELLPDQNGAEKVYAAIRSDGSNFNKVDFAHCTFANVSFKDCTLDQVRFTNCAFIDCYFRNTKVKSCIFSGCKFLNSDLSKVDIRSCDFRYYNTFDNCFIKYNQLSESLPAEGNLKNHLCANLAREARNAGFSSDEGLYRQAGASALEKHLLAAAKGSTPYFKEKYKGSERFYAAYRWMASRLRGYAWGYRRSWLVVMRNWAVLSLLVFPVSFLACRPGLQRGGRPASVGDAWFASLGNILPGSGISDVRFVSNWSLALAFTEILVGLLFVGLIAALLFRSVYERGR